MKGIFIVIEGPDGCGKTTFCKDFVVRLRESTDREVVEIGGSSGLPVVDELRATNLKIRERIEDQPLPLTELLIFYAQRNEILNKVIRPAIERGAIVVSDRFELSTFVYQGLVRELATEVEILSNLVYNQTPPVDHTIFISTPSDIVLERLKARKEQQDRMDVENLMKVHRLYTDIARNTLATDDGVFEFDNSGNVNTYAREQIWGIIRNILHEHQNKDTQAQ